MLGDPESTQLVIKKLKVLAAQAVTDIVQGNYPSLAALERQRGVLTGIGMCIDTLEDKPTGSSHAESPIDDEQNAA